MEITEWLSNILLFNWDHFYSLLNLLLSYIDGEKVQRIMFIII